MIDCYEPEWNKLIQNSKNIAYLYNFTLSVFEERRKKKRNTQKPTSLAKPFKKTLVLY